MCVCVYIIELLTMFRCWAGGGCVGVFAVSDVGEEGEDGEHEAHGRGEGHAVVSQVALQSKV